MPKPLPIATYLRACMHTLGDTQGAFAARMGVGRTTVTTLLNGSQRITPEMAVKLAKVSGTPAAEWLARQAALDLQRVGK